MSLLAAPRTRRRLLRAFTLALGFAPLAGLAATAATDGLGANPIETITHETGESTLRFLLVSLSITPLRRLTGWRALTLERRTFGLFAFFYGSLHFLTYAVLDLGLDLGNLAEDIIERPYITVGFTGWLILLALASTSTRKAARRLGRRWKTLHRLVYVAGTCGVVHFLWLVKADLREPLIYAAVLAVLLGLRLVWTLRARSVQRATVAG